MRMRRLVFVVDFEEYGQDDEWVQERAEEVVRGIDKVGYVAEYVSSVVVNVDSIDDEVDEYVNSHQDVEKEEEEDL